VVAIIPAALCYVVLGVVGWYVGNFVVKPNELVREQPYIAHNIEMTRQAYGLDRFSQREFPAETTVEALRQVMLATRELSTNSPRAVATGSTRSWSTPTATELP
jgi:2-hydroxychromene-2-carboxylate isomerase